VLCPKLYCVVDLVRDKLNSILYTFDCCIQEGFCSPPRPSAFVTPAEFTVFDAVTFPTQLLPVDAMINSVAA
jgi:hypothetical protein